MCKWEQECSDNPLLFDQAFAHQFIKERKSWLINKQSMCAKWQFQLGKHLINHQVDNSANTINIDENVSHGHQCHHFKSDLMHDLIDPFPFQELNSKQLINLQNLLRDDNKDAQNLIKI
jgi:hypothetical protein